MNQTTVFGLAIGIHEERDTLPLESSECSRKTDFSREDPLRADQEIGIEIEYNQTIFPIEGSAALRANSPLHLMYHDGDGTLEVIGWDLRVDLKEGGQLPRLISRRFLKLYSKLVTEGLSEAEKLCFREICDQVDYRGFTRSRELPRYREARLIRKHPCYLQFLSLRNTKVDPRLVANFHALEDGDFFGAWFTVDGDGNINDVRNITILPEPSERSDEADYAEKRPVEFPKALQDLLPNPKDGEL